MFLTKDYDLAETVVTGTYLLVAGGRPPNTDGIGPEQAGVETDARGPCG